jgi:ABC-type amino acid transport substrate-binding protein
MCNIAVSITMASKQRVGFQTDPYYEISKGVALKEKEGAGMV